MNDDILTPDQRVAGLIDPDVPPSVSLAGLPASLIITGLEDQLAQAASGYTDTDYLQPIVEALSLLREKYADDQDTMEEISASFGSVMRRVVEAVASDWGVDAGQLGLDPGAVTFIGDVTEIYRFFVVDRVRNAQEIVYASVLADRRRIADRYRKQVEKRNQTVAEARRFFASFDDVVVWSSIPSYLETMVAEGGPVGTLSDALATLRIDGAPFLRNAAWKFPDEGFAARYVAPAFRTKPGRAGITTLLQGRWREDSPKKVAGSAPNQEDDEE